MKFRLIIIYFFIILNQSYANIDSLKNVLKTSDLNSKSLIINQICESYIYTNSDSAIRYGLMGIGAAKKAGLLANQGYVLNSLGVIYKDKGEYVKALNNFIEAEKLFESAQNDNGKILTTVNIGRVYELQNLFDKALSQYTIALSYAEKVNNKKNVALALNHIGSFYYSTNDKNKSLEYFKKYLDINKEINDVPHLMEALNNIAVLYQELGNYSEALLNFGSFLSYSQRTQDKKSISTSYHNIALVYKDKKEFSNAISYIDSSLFVSKQIKDFDNQREAYSTLSEIYKEQNNFPKALESYQLAMAAKDSLLNQTRDQQFIEMSTKYDTEKKEAENKLLKTEGEKQRAINTAITVGLCLVGALAFFIFRSYREKKKANIQLGAQNKEIKEQKNIIEVKQKEILDSIAYAKRLQDAILPPLNLLRKHVADSFIYYKPKDIVAGDFYWMESISANHVLVAACDCTGHGVPGAMVSVVCSNALNRSVKEFNLTDPGKILDKTRELVLETFEKSDEDVKDGMDISLVSIFRIPNSELLTILWAGANNPLWYFQNNTMNEITANKQPIGKSENPKPYNTHTIQLNKGDMLFLFTDGYADQFGGPKGKKFKYKQLSQLLQKNAFLGMEEQRQALSQTFDNWKGNLEQVDDVCIIGLRV
jgi:serine phosphatase RsbU (regulator of sigma subunit)